MLQGSGLKNIVLRREQFRMADDASRCLEFAKLHVDAKIRNCRIRGFIIKSVRVGRR